METKLALMKTHPELLQLLGKAESTIQKTEVYSSAFIKDVSHLGPWKLSWHQGNEEQETYMMHQSEDGWIIAENGAVITSGPAVSEVLESLRLISEKGLGYTAKIVTAFP